MLFLAALLSCYTVTWLPPLRSRGRAARWRVALSAAMVVAGISHLIVPAPFMQHLPTWIPEREALVLTTGLMEIALGLGLLADSRFTAWLGTALGLYLLAVFPGNIYVAVAGIDVDGQPGGPYPWLRLLLQPGLIALALWSTGSARLLQELRTPVAAPAGEES